MKLRLFRLSKYLDPAASPAALARLCPPSRIRPRQRAFSLPPPLTPPGPRCRGKHDPPTPQHPSLGHAPLHGAGPKPRATIPNPTSTYPSPYQSGAPHPLIPDGAPCFSPMGTSRATQDPQNLAKTHQIAQNTDLRRVHIPILSYRSPLHPNSRNQPPQHPPFRLPRLPRARGPPTPRVLALLPLPPPYAPGPTLYRAHLQTPRTGGPRSPVPHGNHPLPIPGTNPNG